MHGFGFRVADVAVGVASRDVLGTRSTENDLDSKLRKTQLVWRLLLQA